MKLTGKDILKLHGGIFRFSQHVFKATPTFRYAIGRNNKILTPLVDLIRAETKIPAGKDIDDYEIERKFIVSEYSKDGENIEAAKLNEFMNKIEDLKKRKPEVVEKIKAHKEEVEEFLKQEHEVQLHLVDPKYIPETIEDQSALNDMIEIFTDPSFDEKDA